MSGRTRAVAALDARTEYGANGPRVSVSVSVGRSTSATVRPGPRLVALDCLRGTQV